MTEVILHHYPASPVSEKVRIAFGMKGMAWRSVEIPRLPPKPDVMPLTGGYRRTPIVQIGADIYCDSQCILPEIERRFPEPTFFPGASQGMATIFGRWTDSMFDAAAKLLIGANADQLPAEFLKDRGRLFFGPSWNAADLKAGVPHVVAQLRAQFSWVNMQLADKRSFLFGEKPSLADAQAYYLIWFVRARWQGGPALLSEFGALEAWEKRVAAIGHGRPTDMTSAQAIETARAAGPATPEKGDARDAQGLTPGQSVGITPDLNSGEPTVTGTLRLIEPDRIAILRTDARVGTVCVHFPRVGYRVTAL
ncbi:MAG: glutathione S-transferase family protein [Burkholderiales bacterium]